MNFAGRGAGRHQRLARRHTLAVLRQSFFRRLASLLVRRAGLVGIIRPR